MSTGKERIDQEIKAKNKSQKLTREEEFECARIMEAGRVAKKKLDAGESLDKETENEWKEKVRCGEIAREKLICSNLYLVESAAKKYDGLIPKSMELEQLCQAGNEGLIKGIEKFDYRKGNRLSTYVMYWIRSEMYEELRKNHDISFSKKVLNDLKRMKEAQKKFLQEHGRGPSVNELAQRTGFTEKKIKRLLNFLNLMHDADSMEMLQELGKERPKDIVPESSTGLLLLLFERYSDQLEDLLFCASGTKEAVGKQCWLDFMQRREQDTDVWENKAEVVLSAKERKQIQLWIDQWHRGELIQFYKNPKQAFRNLLTPRTVAWILEQYGEEIPRADMRSAMEAFTELELSQLTDDNAPYRLISEKCGELGDIQYIWNCCTNWLYQNYQGIIYDLILEKAVSKSF